MKNCCCRSVCTCAEVQPETSHTSYLLAEEDEYENSKSCSCTESSIDYIPPGISKSAPIDIIKYRCEFKDNKEAKRMFSTEAHVTFDDLYKKVVPFGPTKLPKEPFVSLERFKCSDYCFFDRTEIEKKFDQTWNDATKKICSALMQDIWKFTHKQNFTVFKGVTTMEMFYTTFSYFINDIFRNVKNTIKFFNKLILMHSVQHLPKCLEIFTPSNGIAIYKFFCNIFLENIVLLKAVTSTAYIIKISFSED